MTAGPVRDHPAAVPAGPTMAGDPSRLTPPLLAILAMVIVASMLDLMDSQITNTAAPSIVRDIGGGESLIKWLGASYQLAIGTFLVIGGRLGTGMASAAST